MKVDPHHEGGPQVHMGVWHLFSCFRWIDNVRRLALSMLVVVLAVGWIMVVGWAYFGDTEMTSGRTFAAANLDLKIREGVGGDETQWADGVSATWGATNMRPGDEISGSVDLKSSGSARGSSLQVRASNTVEGNPDMDGMLEIASLTLSDGDTVDDVKALIPDFNGNGWKDLDDLESTPVTLPWGAGSGVRTWEMRLRFHPSAGNSYQGGTVTSTLSFVLTR